jgi:hypothetical protein
LEQLGDYAAQPAIARLLVEALVPVLFDLQLRDRDR